MTKNKNKMTRRNFLATGAVATAAISGFPFVHTSRAQATMPLKIGVIGCGGRGTGAAENALTSAPNIHLIALADPFADRVERCLKTLTSTTRRRKTPLKGVEVKDGHCFTGLDCYKKLLETDVDYVILAEPPGFRPISFAAAIDAGKHVFMEKPVATDPVGVRKILEAGKKAKQKGLSVCVGLDNRHSKSTMETVKRIHDGQIGDVVGGQIYYNTGSLWHRGDEPEWTPMEYQCRNWYYFCWLSGDHIVEQHIHNIDVMTWVMDGYPIRAIGVGGRQVRTAPQWGNIYDHFVIDYEFPNDVHVMSMCRQWKNCDRKVGEFFVGTRGKSDPRREIMGPNSWKFSGEMVTPKVYEHFELIESIRNGNPMEQAELGAYCTLTSIMGREAAYTGKDITWDEILNSDLDLLPKKLEFGPAPQRAVPIPGQPRPL